ncbi:isovaleryl-CoA dehydrogenase [Burkholderia thailandensis]|uniref:Acyl-CoA dehydrogenase domain protein n=1 Tax=Burkholderia thailandensis (strain ATCC 700388 / DSM 13276 / CCUG 48851 / CIP 106301 / E264) TaxID=271848 RepID=Q2T248_BURTA|nr:isovaleryl-CoA dehydrogenase [Burkholderia thailandensis]ABC36402.1 acyl-CoA dehydrogenase domain protein [Burkholderia thailandensis E264]AHI74094.1 acyl-CoA dehydrogenase, C-terminal domain protein [Burkholderia thailandensis 2002721723]AHI78407.1 acyl-CoA dehydrogenase, C-terminal domain protein [Burkholderia thailandensis E444]AIC87129.1 acyl-CoA dehydrogenase, C-terminal domain protein [Burkholderia thailandensis USAMRU Malaysia \
MQQDLMTATHRVTNQAPPLSDYNAFETDAALVEAVQRYDASWRQTALARDGAALTTPDVLALADLANRHAPELATHSPRGERIDALEFHPSWHQLLALLRGEGLHALPFSEPQPGAMAARCAGYYLHAQLESGSLCPLTMTFASIPVLRHEPALFATLRDKLYSREHDARDVPLSQKRSMMVGMGMTEKQGGSDVRSNETHASPLGAPGRGQAYRLVGHKWFFSAPQCDAHLVLARTSGHAGISCFYVPRFSPDGSKNAVHVQRLKDKLGNRSNASGEVEFLNAYGVMIGDEGRGVPTIIEMANYTRLDCVIGSAALMRAALVQAIHHARHRSAFGRLLADQPLMRNVLADLALESEAATALFMRLAHAFEEEASARSPQARGWRRIVTPAAKFWVCKRTLEFTGEAMEVWGGNGYVETAPMARFYREAPVNSIWEGSGNVMCLDVLRAIEREPDAAAALLDEWRDAARHSAPLASALAELTHLLSLEPEPREACARRIAQRIALVAQASLLLRDGPPAVAHAFVATRFGETSSETGRVFGTLPATIDHAALIERAFPA